MLKLFLLICFAVNVLVAGFPSDGSVIEGRIIGGNNTDVSQVPYQAGVYWRLMLVCGGFIVSPTYIVTSAGCAYDGLPADTTIRVGATYFKKGGVIGKVKKFYIHPKYDPSGVDYDVALIELTAPLELNDKKIKPAKLASKEPAPGTNALLSGWGFIDESFRSPEVLQSITIPIYSRSNCEAEYKPHNITFTPRMICAGAKDKRPYHHDNGNPLAYNGEIVGIASFGFHLKNVPGSYTNIANPEIAKFIKDTAKL